MLPASTGRQRVVMPASLKKIGPVVPPPPPVPPAMQVLVLRSQLLPGTGQSSGETHCTQAPLGKTVGSQAGVVPVQPALTVQTTHLPRPPLEIVWQIGVGPLQPRVSVQILQLLVAGSQTGVVPVQLAVQ